MKKLEHTESFDKNQDYQAWVNTLKQQFSHTQLNAVVKVNASLLSFYWDLGADIVARQKCANWGDGLLKQLSQDLAHEFPGIKGFSERNLKYIRQWFCFYSTEPIGQPFVAQLVQIPWGA